MESLAVPALLIGALFVEKGLITQQQLDVALEEQQRTGTRLGEVLVERFGVSRLDLASALAEQWAEYERQGTTDQHAPHAEIRDQAAVSEDGNGPMEDSDETEDVAPKQPIGEIFLERGMVSEQELDLALNEQRESGRRLGEILVGKGNLSRLELASALADQWASFQKLRPPGASNGATSPEEPVPSLVMPTPEASPSAMIPGATSDQVDALRARLEALGGQLDRLSSTTREWREPLEELSASVDERLNAVAHASDESSKAEIASLSTRVDELAATIAAAPTTEPLPADLPDRVAQFGAAIQQQESRLAELAAAKEESEGKNRGGRKAIAALEERLDDLVSQPVAGLDELRASVSELASRVEQPVVSDEWREPLESLANDLREQIAAVSTSGEPVEGVRDELASLAARIDAIPAPVEDWHEPLESLANDLRERVGAMSSSAESVEGLRGELASLVERFDAVPLPSEEWREEIQAVGSRLDEISASTPAGIDELRTEIAALGERLNAIPAPTDEWKTELGDVAGNFRTRFELLEADLAARADNAAVAERLDGMRGELESLSSQVAAIPAPSDEWKIELGQVAENLRTRFERVEAALATQPEAGADPENVQALCGQVDALSSRVDAIPMPSDEWKTELGQVAENLRARFDRVESDLAARADDGAVNELRHALSDLDSRVAAIPQPSEEWSEGLRELATRFDELPVPNEDWREVLDALVARIDAIPENLRVRLDRVDSDLAARVDPSAIAELAERLDGLANGLPERFGELHALHSELSERVAAIPPPSDEWRHKVAQVAENLRIRVERVEVGLEQRPSLDLIAGLRDELQALSGRIDADLHERDERDERAVGQGTHVDWLAGRIAQTEERLAQTDEIEQRLRNELAPMVDGAVASVTNRLAGVESALEEHKTGGADVAPRLDELTERIEKQARRIEKLRDEGPTAAQVAEALGARLEASEAVASDAYASLDERLTALGGQIASSSDRAASDGDVVRRELDELRGISAATAEASATNADQLAERLRAETATTVAVALAETDSRAAAERLEGLVAAQAAAFEALQAGLGERERLADERLAALEKSQSKRSDVRDLREALVRVEKRITAETAQEDTRVEAVEGAVRDGLAGLASRLAESEGAYFQAGDSLRRSIEHLGSALRGADAHRASDPEISEVASAAKSFLAFAPTSEGYRLVELEGVAPGVGAAVEVPGCEVALSVARLGSSPLPFDRRSCVYLELSA